MYSQKIYDNISAFKKKIMIILSDNDFTAFFKL